MQHMPWKIICLMLHELRHTQMPTPLHTKNPTSIGITNNIVKWQRSRAMDMIFFVWFVRYTSEFYILFWHQDKKIWGVITLSINSQTTTNKSVHFIYIYEIRQLYYKGICPQVRCEGVSTCPMVTYIDNNYPWLLPGPENLQSENLGPLRGMCPLSNTKRRCM